jgi:hypothetical protein
MAESSLSDKHRALAALRTATARGGSLLELLLVPQGQGRLEDERRSVRVAAELIVHQTVAQSLAVLVHGWIRRSRGLVTRKGRRRRERRGPYVSETKISLLGGSEAARESVSPRCELLPFLGLVGVPHEVHQRHRRDAARYELSEEIPKKAILREVGLAREEEVRLGGGQVGVHSR